MKASAWLTATLLLLAGGSAVAETTLRIGIQDDPDVLDPHRSRTYSGRLVYTALCDKLVDVSPQLELVPQLATAWQWSDDNRSLTLQLRKGVTFHDGESELASVDTVEVVDSQTVRIRLQQPDATLLAQLSDRAGMMLAPKASAGDVGSKPVCSGPYRFVQRVQQDRIVLGRFP